MSSSTIDRLHIVDADPQGADALGLLRLAAVEARALYPELVAADAPWPTNAATPRRGAYLVAYLGQGDTALPVACGAIRPHEGTTAEVRRIFVRRERRRRGLARAMLVALEARAAALGYEGLVLETGCRQAAAIALYEACGYRRIAPFGEHVDDPTSVCLAKPVAAPAARCGGSTRR